MYDIFGVELLNQKLNQSFNNIKIESFIFNNELIHEINCLALHNNMDILAHYYIFHLSDRESLCAIFILNKNLAQSRF
jgi:hypothetical protein